MLKGDVGEWCNAQLDQYGNGANERDRNMTLGAGGATGHRNQYNGGAGFRTSVRGDDHNPKCFARGMAGGSNMIG